MTPSERALLVAIGHAIKAQLQLRVDEALAQALVAVERERTEPHASHCSCGHAVERIRAQYEDDARCGGDLGSIPERSLTEAARNHLHRGYLLAAYDRMRQERDGLLTAVNEYQNDANANFELQAQLASSQQEIERLKAELEHAEYLTATYQQERKLQFERADRAEARVGELETDAHRRSKLYNELAEENNALETRLAQVGEAATRAWSMCSVFTATPLNEAIDAILALAEGPTKENQ